MIIIKRNGEEVKFDSRKIFNAICSSMKGLYKTDLDDEDLELAEDITSQVANYICLEDGLITVEDIQNEIENALMNLPNKDLAKNYMLYRYKRSMIRESNTTDDSIMQLINREKNEVSYDNSNKNSILNSTQRDLIAGETSKDIARRILFPQHVIDAHDKGIYHVHDLDYSMQKGMFNCCLIDIKDMLDNGTSINGIKIESPKSFQVACTVMTQIMAAVASSQFGGQSVNIKHLGKYLRKTRIKAFCHYHNDLGFGESLSNTLAIDRMMDDLKSGVQTIQYQINTLMTTNGQSPFVTIFLHLDESDEYIDEIQMIVYEIIKQRYEGITNKQDANITPAFPKLIYVLDENNNLSGGKFDYITKLCAKCSAKRMYPDYISAKKMREAYDGEVFSSMGCRSFLSNFKDEDGNYKWEGRFNQGVVSINLPQIGIVSNGDEDTFWKILEERLEMCYEVLMCKHKLLKGTISDASPIHWQDGAIARLDKGEVIDKYLYNGYSTISLGYIGLYELSILMTGKSHTETDGLKFSLRVMNKLRETTERWKNDTTIGFGLYGSPAESLCYRFAKIDTEQFGIIENVTDKGYYTNSYHVDVREKIDMFSKFMFESQFQPISNGGCISYAEIPYMMHNIEAVESGIKFIYDTIQYAEFNTKCDYCQVCGFEGEMLIDENIKWYCPNCNNRDESKLTITRRTCGYLGTNFWNLGKTKEIKERKLHL